VCFDKNPTLVISLPVKQAIIKKLSLDFDETDVRNVIELEMHQHIVGTPENYAIDFMPLTSQAGSNEALKYLAVAYNNSALRRLYSYFGSKHFFGSIVDLDVFALINAFRNCISRIYRQACDDCSCRRNNNYRGGISAWLLY